MIGAIPAAIPPSPRTMTGARGVRSQLHETGPEVLARELFELLLGEAVRHVPSLRSCLPQG